MPEHNLSVSAGSEEEADGSGDEMENNGTAATGSQRGCAHSWIVHNTKRLHNIATSSNQLLNNF